MVLLKSYSSTKKTPEIEMPDMLDLINSPFYHLAALEDVYKYSNDTLRYLIDKLNLNNNTKYVTAQIYVHFLNKNVYSVPRGTWHQDIEDEKFTTHLLITDCTAKTEFLADEIEIKLSQEDIDDAGVETYLNQNRDTFKSIAVEPNKFITFTNHYHRAINASVPEFRFMLRVIESDTFVSKTYHDAVSCGSQVFKDNFDYDHLTREDMKRAKQNLIVLPSVFKDGKYITINTYDD